MRLVDRAVTYPSRCAVIPFIGQDHADGFIDTGAEMIACGKDQHVYVSVVAARQMASLLGWTPPDAAALVVERVAVLEAEKAQLEAELADADVRLQAIDALESAGFRARKKPGRPAKVKDEEVVA